MASLTVRKLDDAVKARLRARAAASGRSVEEEIRVILREVYRDPGNGNLVSFPRQVSATRAYLRERDSLRARDESEFIMLDDDDDTDDDSAADTSDEDDSPDQDGDGFMDDALQIDEEDTGI
mgnify:CR=1 FL=1